MGDDLTRMVTVIVETLPIRLRGTDRITESMIAEALDLFQIDQLIHRPETRAALADIRELLAIALAKAVREKHGPQYETIQTGLYSCSRCRHTPVLCVVVQESPCHVVWQCQHCGYEERKTLLDGELSEIRFEGSPVDVSGKPVVKKRRRGNSDGVTKTDSAAGH